MQRFATIANPARRRIAEPLAARDRTAGEWVVEFDIARLPPTTCSIPIRGTAMKSPGADELGAPP